MSIKQLSLPLMFIFLALLIVVVIFNSPLFSSSAQNSVLSESVDSDSEQGTE